MISQSRSVRVSLVVATCFGALLVGQLIGTGRFNFQLLLFSVVGLSFFLIIISNRRSLHIGMLLWIGMFILGYRTLPVTSVLRLHPQLLLALFMFALLLVPHRDAPKIASREMGLPSIFLPVFLLFWVNGWLQGLARGRSWDLMAGDALNVLLFIPVLTIAGMVMRDRAFWRPVLTVFFVAGTLIAALGLLEYSIPDLAQYALPGFILTDQTTFETGPEGFLRASFAFWGAPAATFVCMLSMPMVMPLWSWSKRPELRVGLLVGTIVQALGIYIGGYRSIWALTIVVLMVVLVGRRNPLLMLLGIGLLLLTFSIIPETGQERALRALEALQGVSSDHSIEVRYERAFDAIQVGLANPLGVGWGGTGWTHSDVAQFAGNLGPIAAILFVGWYFWTLFNAWRVQQRQPDTIMIALTAGYVGAGGLLLLQGVQVLTQLVAPVWFVWALALIRVQQLRDDDRSARQAEHPYPHLQQPGLHGGPAR